MPGKGDTTSAHQVCPPVPPLSSLLGCLMGRWQGLGDDLPFTFTPPNPPLHAQRRSGGGPNALPTPPPRGGGRRGPSASSIHSTCHYALGGRLVGRPDRGLHSAKEQGSPCCKTGLWAACSQAAELWKAGLGQGTAVSGASLSGERQVWVEGQRVPDIVLREVNWG